ncbi:MAG: HigA family addiction module antitoxin [Candidatus Aquilonibacter sp.]
MTKKLAPIHPGEVLLEDFMKPMSLTANRLALDLRVPSNRITGIVNGRRAITADTALRLARYFGTSPDVWLGLQIRYDLDVAEDEAAGQIEREVRPRELIRA